MGETFDNYAAKVNKDKLLVIEGEVQFNEFSGGCRARQSYSLLMRRGSVLARDWRLTLATLKLRRICQPV